MAQNVELESILYAIGMESSTGYRHMEMLCDLLAVPFPPRNKPKEKNVNCDNDPGPKRHRENNQSTQSEPGRCSADSGGKKAPAFSFC
jgi:hypothetical protein